MASERLQVIIGEPGSTWSLGWFAPVGYLGSKAGGDSLVQGESGRVPYL
jgi:hypothetical protein